MGCGGRGGPGELLGAEAGDAPLGVCRSPRSTAARPSARALGSACARGAGAGERSARAAGPSSTATTGVPEASASRAASPAPARVAVEITTSASASRAARWARSATWPSSRIPVATPVRSPCSGASPIASSSASTPCQPQLGDRPCAARRGRWSRVRRPTSRTRAGVATVGATAVAALGVEARRGRPRTGPRGAGAIGRMREPTAVGDDGEVEAGRGPAAAPRDPLVGAQHPGGTEAAGERAGPRRASSCRGTSIDVRDASWRSAPATGARRTKSRRRRRAGRRRRGARPGRDAVGDVGEVVATAGTDRHHLVAGGDVLGAEGVDDDLDAGRWSPAAGWPLGRCARSPPFVGPPTTLGRRGERRPNGVRPPKRHRCNPQVGESSERTRWLTQRRQSTNRSRQASTAAAGWPLATK